MKSTQPVQRLATSGVRNRADTAADRRATRGRPSTRWPAFLVSAAREEAIYTPDGVKWMPYGMWHARKTGSLLTACGRSAVEWHYFWTLSFTDAQSEACPGCVRAVRAELLGDSEAGQHRSTPARRNNGASDTGKR